MSNGAYRHWMDSLNFFLGIHLGYDHFGDLDGLSKRYLFHRRTIWIVRYAVSSPVCFITLLLALSWFASGWFVLPWLAFNLLVFPPFILWLFLRLRIIKHK